METHVDAEFAAASRRDVVRNLQRGVGGPQHREAGIALRNVHHVQQIPAEVHLDPLAHRAEELRGALPRVGRDEERRGLDQVPAEDKRLFYLRSGRSAHPSLLVDGVLPRDQAGVTRRPTSTPRWVTFRPPSEGQYSSDDDNRLPEQSRKRSRMVSDGAKKSDLATKRLKNDPPD